MGGGRSADFWTLTCFAPNSLECLSAEFLIELTPFPAPLARSAKFEAASEGVTRELRESLTVAKTQTLEQQSQNNQLAAQLVIAEGRCVKLTTEVEAASEALNAAEMVGKRMEWELAETSKANAAQIAEMQWEVDHKKTGMVATIERFDRKIALLSEVPPLPGRGSYIAGVTHGCMSIDNVFLVFFLLLATLYLSDPQHRHTGHWSTGARCAGKN